MMDVRGSRLLYRGAEADLLVGEWAGVPAVYKMRKPLPYRLEALDSAIRTKRTAHEASMIHQAKSAGISAPYLYFVDPKRAVLVMEYVEGERMKNILEGSSRSEVVKLSRGFGEAVGALHLEGIMHGDLTTSNVIVRDGQVVFIDFGLSVATSKLEDHAVDLRLIKETLNGAHSDVYHLAFPALLEGYRGKVGDARLADTKRKLVEIERRGRYAKVE